MKKEEKELLKKDLYGRLSYGFVVHRESDNVDIVINDIHDFSHFLEYIGDNDFKPYLRPMSSMTKEEREEIEVLLFPDWFDPDSCKVDGEGYIEILANYDVSGIEPGFCGDYVDFLLEHHLDFRGLIGKGLALKAKEGMYENQNLYKPRTE